MNRVKRHVYLVISEKIYKESKRDLQRLLASEKSISKSLNDLIKVLNKATAENVSNTVKVMLGELKNDKMV